MKFAFTILLLMLCVPLAAAQELSLKTLPAGEEFISPDRTVSIAMPRIGYQTENEAKDGQKITRYRWTLAEGQFSLAVIEGDSVMDNPALVDALMAVTGAKMRAEPGTKIISQQKLGIGEVQGGEVHGGEVIRKVKSGEKIIFQMYGRGKAMHTLTFTVKKSKTADADEALAKKALASFKFLPVEKVAAEDMFVDPANRFSITLPREPAEIKSRTETGNDGSATQYKWLLREGTFYLAVTTFERTSFDRKVDVDSYIDDLIGRLMEISDYRFQARRELQQGLFNGAEILRVSEKGQIIMQVYAHGQVMYTLTAMPDKKAADAEALMRKALESFKINTQNK